jgi:hypothetical protein
MIGLILAYRGFTKPVNWIQVLNLHRRHKREAFGLILWLRSKNGQPRLGFARPGLIGYSFIIRQKDL